LVFTINLWIVTRLSAVHEITPETMAATLFSK